MDPSRTLLPNQCLCGEVLVQGWTSLTENRASYVHDCTECRRQAYTITYGMKVRVFPATSDLKLSPSARGWIHTDLTTTLEALIDRLRKVEREAERQEWCLQMDLLGEPYDCQIRFVDGRRVLLRPDSTEASPVSLTALDEVWSKRRPHASAYDLLHDLPGLPNLPADVEAFFWDPKAGHWYPVNREVSSVLKVPPHPVRVEHDKRWKAIFERLECVLDTWDKTEIENGYDKNPHQPWYKLEVPGCFITVGPRRHVDAIRVVMSEEYRRLHDLDCKDWFPRLEALSKKDKVTWYADYTYLEKNFGERAFEVIIHAWSDDKVVEYIKTLFGYEE